VISPISDPRSSIGKTKHGSLPAFPPPIFEAPPGELLHVRCSRFGRDIHPLLFMGGILLWILRALDPFAAVVFSPPQ